MSNLFLTFSNTSYMKPNRILKQAESFECFDKVEAKTEKDIQDFIDKHKSFIEQNPTGYGLWIWKPKIILDTLLEIEENDILVYADAGTYLNKDGKNTFNKYIERLTGECSVITFNTSDKYQIRYFVKMDAVMSYFPPADNCNEPMSYAGLMLIRKNDRSVTLIREWLSLCENHDLIDRNCSRNNKELECFQGNDCDNGLLKYDQR